jgi:hypothetical protein
LQLMKLVPISQIEGLVTLGTYGSLGVN